MKARFKKIIFCVVFIICCGGCGKSEAKLPRTIDIILNRYGVSSVRIEKLANYRECKLDNSIEVSDDEIKEYIDIQMEGYSRLLEITDRAVVETGDVVVVSYVVSREREVIKEVTRDVLKVGRGNYDLQFENTLIGQMVGIPFTKNIISPTGASLSFDILVESINYYESYELTDEFVQENMEVNTVEEYIEKCKAFLLDKRRKEQLFAENIDGSKFVLNSSMKENREEVFRSIYESEEREINEYILIGAIFSDLKYSVTEDEMRAKCEQLGYDYSNIKEHEYQYALVEFAIMEQKVLSYFESEFSMRN